MEGNDLPTTNELGFIDFVLENLLGMISSKACYDFQSQLRMIHDELSSLRYSLGKIEGVRSEQKDLEALWNDGVKVAYRVEFLVDDLVFGDFQGSSSTSFDSTVEDILREAKSMNSKIRTAPDIKMKKVTITPNPVPFENSAPVADEIVGFDDDITSIIDRLTRGSKQLKVVAIVGMPGTGKTTLATKVFHHPSVTHHFHVCISCCVSHLFGKKKWLLELLNLDPNTNNEMSEQDLSEKLWKHLKGKRYLIVLDDIWDIEAWDGLKTSFPDDCYGSRILVTSRHRDAVPQAMLDEEPLSPSKLTEDQSWELLQKMLPPRSEWSLALDEIEKKIAANCLGLPLTIVVAAGLLANTEPQDWNIFLETDANHSMNILELSYKYLPGHLKQCFLYFGLFPEDHEVSVKRLIRLWIAEGFVLKTESKSLEGVARDHILELARRSLVIVSQERSRGGVKACRIHDLLHDFCGIKAKDEKFFHSLKGGYDEFLSFEEPGYMRRLCFHSELKHFKKLRQICPRLHSLLFFAHGVQRCQDRNISFIIPRYSRLRVLDIAQYHLPFWIGIPSDIGLVLQLKYLSVSGDISNIPSSIGSLTNLETFILHSYKGEVSLPDTFWNLQKLRHVDIKNGFLLEFENLEKFPELCELQSCSTAVIRHGGSIERLVRKFPNILKLHCHLDPNEIEILIPDSLSQLESLHLSLWWSQLDCMFEFDLPDSLRKLSLTDFGLHQSHVSRIGKLPNLEVLKFCGVDFYENTWDMVEGEFSKLRFLKLNMSKIVKWASSDNPFPCLEKLVLERCNCLEEIPSCFCFHNIVALEMVELKYCCDTVNTFFKGIQHEQKEYGYSLPKIQMKEVSITPNSFQNRALVADDIVGFDDDITSVIDRLTRGSMQLKMVAIVGMPGMGKTTLATKVFHHPSVTYHFHVRLWCCVSQLFHKKNLLLELLNHVDSNTNIGMSEQELTEKLWRHLKGKRYLIFLDDLWDIEAWDSLEASFPNDSYGSRILVTSRQHHAVPQAMLDEEALSPHQLTEDQSWELLQKKLPPRNEWSLALYEIGKQIAANCKGLPLTVVIVAGLLANTEPEDWQMFLESIRSVSGANHCMDTLELSYKHLPGHLKQCFLYFGLFPEDHEVPARRLIRLWIAEGFVHRSKSKSIEDVARDYMMDLVGRSLVIVSKERSIGGVKACRIHDLLHDFCRTKAKEENFLQVLEGGYDEFISFKEPEYIRLLSVRSEKKHFKNLRLFCPPIHSLLFFTRDKDEERSDDGDISFIIPRYSHLRVLDISQYSLSLTFGIPSEIGLVIQLKYLSVTGEIANIPSSIGSLANLETFILHSYRKEEVSMPGTFWNLHKLRYVDIKPGFRLAFENLEKFPELRELQSCSTAIIHHGDSIERLVRKFPNIRKLRCRWKGSDKIKILTIDSLRQLESLDLTSRCRFQFVFPYNLRKLSLAKVFLEQSDVSRIGELPILEVLKFRDVDFEENTWAMEEGEFSSLRFLELNFSSIVRWTDSDDQFPCLEKLVLNGCRDLEEIPCCFESIDTLEMVEVTYCSGTVDNFFKRIQAEQTELGNSFLLKLRR